MYSRKGWNFDIVLPGCCLAPRRFREKSSLQGMLQHAGHATDTLYYELLDMPLPQLEQLKSLRVRCNRRRLPVVCAGCCVTGWRMCGVHALPQLEQLKSLRVHAGGL